MLRDRDLEALERRDYPTPETSRGIDYTPAIHGGVYPDGVRIYEDGKLLVTVTTQMLRDGWLEDFAKVASR